MSQRICRYCGHPCSDSRGRHSECAELRKGWAFAQECRDSEWIRDVVPMETRKDRRAAKASARTTRRPTG